MSAIYEIEKPDANECFAKFIKAQKEFGKTIKNTTNSHWKNKYADLNCVIDAVKDALNDNGLMITQLVEKEDVSFVLRTMVFDANGHSIDFGIIPIKPVKDDPQGFGSALTYARRYGLMTAFGLAPEDDDDGNRASGIFQKDFLIKEVGRLGLECTKNGYTNEDVKKALLNVPSASLTEEQAKNAIEALNKLLESKKG